METKTKITVLTNVKAPVSKVWELWNGPEHITQWCNASSDWHAPYSENDLRKDGKFKTTMAAKDGSMSFDFEGVYTNVEKYKLIEYTLTDDRTVRVEFTDNAGETQIVETFVAEDTNPEEMQRNGWQAILDNFKSYVEAN